MPATIYKIYCRDIEIKECYIGSTEDFTQRCSEHKSACNNTNNTNHNLKVYKFIRANLGMDNFIIQEIIDCDLENRYDCELHYFKLFEAKLNSQFPKRSSKDYYNDNREKILEYTKQKYNDNKQTISEKAKQKYNDNKQTLLEKRKIKIECECGSVVRKADISTHFKSIKHQNYINSKL